MSSFITTEKVSLDYILKTGSISIRKFILQRFKKLLRQPTDQRNYNTVFRALHNINLEIKTGDKLGIFGRNGAGKSTLLRVLADIYKPNFGTVLTHGTSSCLFDINLGLNAEANGYENIITMCILKGMTKQQALNVVKDVEEFTELGDFLYNPVRMYSAGMKMKLAFGVATAGNPDILLVDEVIGVGDGKFMQKANKRIEDLMHNSNILVLTSHDNAVIKKFCNKAIVLDQGNLVFQGNVDDACAFYENILYDTNNNNSHHLKNSDLLHEPL